MPYESIESLPTYVKKYSHKVKSQWRHVFNTVNTKTGSEARAFRAANSVLKNRLNKSNTLEENYRHDDINMLVDLFLDNLKG